MDTIIRRALIIGAGGGVGREIAVQLAGAGMKLALTGPDAADLMRTAALTGRPLDMLVLPADIAAKRGQDDILHIMQGHLKGLDALVNCAGGAARELCRRALSLLEASDRPVVLELGGEAALSAGEAAGIRLEALDGGATDERAIRALAEKAVRIVLGED